MSGLVKANARFLLIFVMLGFATSCSGPSEAPRVELSVVSDSSGLISSVNDLGYEVQVSSIRVAVSNLVFTIAGEAHTASAWRSVGDLLVTPAFAHPGHYQGGEVTGELSGDFVVDWSVGTQEEIGTATLLAGTYTAANFTFARASALDGHTAIIKGVASKEGVETSFVILVDSPEGRELVGVPFEAKIDKSSTGTLKFGIISEKMFDGLDFLTLHSDGDGALVIGPDISEVEAAYNVFRRGFQTHDPYVIQYQE